VAVTPSELLITAPYFDHMDGTEGVVYRFSRNALDSALPTGSVRLDPPPPGKGGGSSTLGDGGIAADETILAVPFSQSCRSVHVYRLGNPPELLEAIDQPAGSSSSFGQGMSVEAASRTVVVGSPGDSVQGQPSAGTARIFRGFGRIFASGFEDNAVVKSEKGAACSG
jgi:hypothetical protein